MTTATIIAIAILVTAFTGFMLAEWSQSESKNPFRKTKKRKAIKKGKK